MNDGTCTKKQPGTSIGTVINVHGKEAIITTAEPMADMITINMDRKQKWTTQSKVATSSEQRFNMTPCGCCSKNLSGFLSRLVKKMANILRDATIPPKAVMKAQSMTRTPDF